MVNFEFLHVWKYILPSVLIAHLGRIQYSSVQITTRPPRTFTMLLSHLLAPTVANEKSVSLILVPL